MNGSDMSDWLLDNVDEVLTAYFNEFGYDDTIHSVWDLPEEWLFNFYTNNYL